MVATDPQEKKTVASRQERSSETRDHAPVRSKPAAGPPRDDAPAAGAHAAHHLINEDATPGAGALPSRAHQSGKEVDGGAG